MDVDVLLAVPAAPTFASVGFLSELPDVGCASFADCVEQAAASTSAGESTALAHDPRVLLCRFCRVFVRSNCVALWVVLFTMATASANRVPFDSVGLSSGLISSSVGTWRLETERQPADFATVSFWFDLVVKTAAAFLRNGVITEPVLGVRTCFPRRVA